jgi:polar amino acid transport system substrate-binding protein
MKHEAVSFPLLCLAAAVALPGLAAAPAAAQEPLRWAADAEGGAPFIFKDPANPKRTIGFEVDLARELARELGRPIKFVQYEYIKLIEGLDRGDFDFAMNGLDVTEDRLKKVRFSRPYYAYGMQLVVRDDETRFTTLQGIKNLGGVVGTLEDSAASRFLERRGVRGRFYSDQTGPFQDLEQKELDAVLFDYPIALYYGRKSLVTPKQPPFKFVGDIRGHAYYAIAFAKNNEALAQEFDRALIRLTLDGTLKRIYEKWGLWNDRQQALLADLLQDARAAAALASPAPFMPLTATATVLAGQDGAPTGVLFMEDDEDEGETDGGGAFLRLLLDGAKMTVFLTCISFLVAVALALPIAMMRLYGAWPLQALATGYVEFFRGIPVLLLLAVLYYGLPAIAQSYGWADHGVSLKMPAVVAAVVGFGLNYAAYEAEIYRAGLGSIPVGQWEAARSLGMSDGQTFRRIILPQSLRIILPPMTNDLVALFKDTSVVSVIAVVELSKQYLILTRSGAGDLATIALATAALYLVMSVPLGLLSRYLERRWAVHH